MSPPASPSLSTVSCCEVVICTPYTNLETALALTEGSNVKVGAENCHWAESGAFTGEISAPMLKEPLRGKANRQLIQTLAKTLGISEQKVELLSGHKSARKTVLVKGISRDEAISKLTQKTK